MSIVKTIIDFQKATIRYLRSVISRGNPFSLRKMDMVIW